jgi:predicted Zn finger-like uncharacterized protein
MPAVACPHCGATYNLKDEFLDQLVKCAQCRQSFAAVATAEMAAQPQAHAIYDRDRFFMRQKMMSIDAKYTVNDEQKQPFIWIIRRAHFLKGALATLAALVTALLVGGAIIGAAVAILGEPKGDDTKAAILVVAIVLGIVLAVVAAMAVGIAIYPKRHVEFFADPNYTQPILDVQQDAKWQFINATYTVRDAGGQTLARLHKNFLYNFFRKRWNVRAPGDDTLICRAFEDSILLSILRRFLGTFYGLLRTNFVITEGAGDRVIGEFNRKFTITDQYVLDLSADPQRTLDRRIAVALGVMLDTGEKR